MIVSKEKKVAKKAQKKLPKHYRSNERVLKKTLTKCGISNVVVRKARY
jgi:hypothetical protein